MLKNITHSTLFILSIMAVLLIAIFGFSQVIAFFNTGADRAEMLLLSSPEISSTYQPKATWVPNPQAEGRTLEKGTKIKVLNDYLTSYYYLYNQSSTWFAKGLKDYFTFKSRKQVAQLASLSEKSDQSLHGTSIEHHIKPKFYAADGTLMVITDQVVSFNEVKINQEKNHYYDTSTYEVMLLLEDNFWRVRHKMRTNEHIKHQLSTEKIKRPIEVVNGQFSENGETFDLKCINYYPQNYPWVEMWDHFEEIDFKSDLQKVKELGFNSIRIFVPFEEFGRDKVKGERLNQLNQLLNITDELKLKVIVTLFDFFLGYHVQEWTISDRHLETVTNAIKQHPSLFAYDIKNEPDLDFENIGQDQIKNWLAFTIKRLRNYDPEHFITIGWSQPEIANELTHLVDFISFHFYRNPTELNAFLLNNHLKDLPIFIGEIGMHSFNSWWHPFGKSQAEQATHVEQILKIIKSNQLHYGLWTLYDFKHVPSNVAGSVPWKRNPQKRYGIIDTKQREKKLYDIILKYNCNEK